MRAKMPVLPSISRMVVEIGFLDFRIGVRIRLKLCFDFITERGQGGPATRIPNDTFPFGVAVQLR